jgi:hypothetical protein
VVHTSCMMLRKRYIPLALCVHTLLPAPHTDLLLSKVISLCANGGRHQLHPSLQEHLEHCQRPPPPTEEHSQLWADYNRRGVHWMPFLQQYRTFLR